MTQLGFKRSDFDHAVFHRSNPFTIIFIHVDDMTLVTKTLAIMEKLKKDIGAIIEVVDSGTSGCGNNAKYLGNIPIVFNAK